MRAIQVDQVHATFNALARVSDIALPPTLGSAWCVSEKGSSRLIIVRHHLSQSEFATGFQRCDTGSSARYQLTRSTAPSYSVLPDACMSGCFWVILNFSWPKGENLVNELMTYKHSSGHCLSRILVFGVFETSRAPEHTLLACSSMLGTCWRCNIKQMR